MPHPTKAAKIGPMAVQLEVEFLDRLTEPVREKKAKSVSAIIRTALERYDFTHMVIVRTAQVMISVRLPADLRRTLKKTARTKHTSVGQLVRTAVEAYLPELEAGSAGRLKIPMMEKASKVSATRPAKSKTAAPRSGRRPKPATRLMTKKRKG